MIGHKIVYRTCRHFRDGPFSSRGRQRAPGAGGHREGLETSEKRVLVAENGLEGQKAGPLHGAMGRGMGAPGPVERDWGALLAISSAITRLQAGGSADVVGAEYAGTQPAPAGRLDGPCPTAVH